ncbi:MAG TPA: triphosphoribosyl-dephospho-CoA synthase [Vicinamibacterales bacterium]
MPSPPLTASDIAVAAQLACLLEVSAPKPGNVSPGRPFADMGVEDFLASAVAIGPAMAHAGERPLGVTVRDAVEATARWTRANTNLGIVLLFAPLARAAHLCEPTDGLRAALTRVLVATTVDDARRVYQAIRLASPGGLGEAPAQDVKDEPTASLLDVMRLAADRDDIAGEYATAFETTFETGAVELRRLRVGGRSWDDAIVQTFLTLLAARPDTHIARRAGVDAARRVSADARAVLDRGGVATPAGRAALQEFDDRLRDPANPLNPGTTADLTAAAIFVHLLGPAPCGASPYLIR